MGNTPGKGVNSQRPMKVHGRMACDSILFYSNRFLDNVNPRGLSLPKGESLRERALVFGTSFSLHLQSRVGQ
jgi:hypothetical protein